MLGTFASNTNFIEVVHIAWVIDWKHIWIETDSMLVIHYLFKAPMRSLGSLWWNGRIVYGDFVKCGLYVHIFIEKEIRLLIL